VFFNDEKTSEIYADEQLTHCPGYGRSLERDALISSLDTGICKPVQVPATPDRSLVMRLGQRFESARRLFQYHR
jgi:hypothetical protein